MKVLIADDHPLVRDALSRTVQVFDPQAEVLLADNFDGVERQCDLAFPDIALIDLNMPGMEGLVGLRRLRQRHPTLPVLVASGQDDLATIRAVLATGVSGFVSKSESGDQIVAALRTVLAGGAAIPPSALGLVVAGLREAPRPHLTDRQMDVLCELMRHGASNHAIGEKLGLAEGTVRVHIAAILRALEARNRTDAVVRARALGIRCPDQ